MAWPQPGQPYTTPLCPLMDKYGSDKGPRKGDSSHHTYTPVYHELFKSMTDRALNVFELGLGTNNTNFLSNMGPNGRPGASLRAWRDYFPRSSIFGADIDKGVLFEEDRIRTAYCDQTNPVVVRSMWESLPDMDIIIDDGLHTFEANVTFFENSIHKLKPTGMFVIEDIDNLNIERFRSKIAEWRLTFPTYLFHLHMLTGGNPCDNNMLVVSPVTISVCIPTMRRFSFLKESIPRYLANPHVTELVIVDETGEDYAAITAAFSHPKLRVYQNETRLGVLKNKLCAASYATSDFIAILDSDNFADVGYFQAFKQFYSTYTFSDSAIFLPSFARPRFDYREWVGRHIDKTNVRNFLPRIETCLNTMNLIVSRSYMKRLTILDDKPTCDQVSCYDSQYFALYGMFVMNATLFVVDGMEYEHRVHDESWWIISHPTEGDKSYHELRRRFFHIMDLVTWQTNPKPEDSLIVQASSTNEDDAWMPFPIGMHYTYTGAFRFGDHSQTVLCALNPYTDTRRRPSGKNRLSILTQLTANGIPNTQMSPDMYLDILPSYKFVVSPEGNGIDCHRHYEALIAGCIPIIERNPLTEEKYRGCPVLWTTDYSEITPAYLDAVYEDMKGRVYDFSRLFLAYYPPNVQTEIKRCGNYWMMRHGKAPFY